jgi:hypothetical protein
MKRATVAAALQGRRTPAGLKPDPAGLKPRLYRAGAGEVPISRLTASTTWRAEMP